ncbi:MAG TPA: hypothetical protein ENJ00_02880 [Phycisphaerales bacterium]|nr:hypothetical protein [Phycisphaerales bacterium]
MKICTCVVVASLAGSVQAQSLAISITPDITVAGIGDTVTWTIRAELLNPLQGEVIRAVVSDFGFDLDHGGDTDLSILNNEFQPAFDSTFFGPAADGVVSGDSIIGAVGVNTLPPLNNPSGPDDSNPLLIYTYQTTVTGGNARIIEPSLTLVGQISGAYIGTPFDQVFFYQLADGSPGTVPFSIDPGQVAVVPGPGVLMIAGGAGLLGFRRRRMG